MPGTVRGTAEIAKNRTTTKFVTWWRLREKWERLWPGALGTVLSWMYPIGCNVTSKLIAKSIFSNVMYLGLESLNNFKSRADGQTEPKSHKASGRDLQKAAPSLMPCPVSDSNCFLQTDFLSSKGHRGGAREVEGCWHRPREPLPTEKGITCGRLSNGP